MVLAPRMLALGLLIVLLAAPSATAAQVHPDDARVVWAEWTCTFDPATGVLDKMMLDPGPGKVAWGGYSRSEPMYGNRTSEPCLGPIDGDSQVPATSVREVRMTTAYPAMITIRPLEDRGAGIKTVITSTSKVAPRVFAYYGNSNGVDSVERLTAYRGGIDTDSDGTLDVVIVSPNWNFSMDARVVSGRFDLRRVPTSPGAGAKFNINTYSKFTRPVTLLGPWSRPNVQVHTGSGNDTIRLFGGHNYVATHAGHDRITTGRGQDIVFAGAGNDVVRTGAGSDYVSLDGNSYGLGGGFGNDVAYLGPGNDHGYGGKGRDRLYGGPGHDELGVVQRGLIIAGPGDDRIFSASNSVRVQCGPGVDTGNSTRPRVIRPGCELSRDQRRRMPYVPATNDARYYWCNSRTEYCRARYYYNRI